MGRQFSTLMNKRATAADELARLLRELFEG
jgi:hypothetical protein